MDPYNSCGNTYCKTVFGGNTFLKSSYIVHSQHINKHWINIL